MAGSPFLLEKHTADEEPVDQKRYLEESCKPKCVKPLLEYQKKNEESTTKGQEVKRTKKYNVVKRILEFSDMWQDSDGGVREGGEGENKVIDSKSVVCEAMDLRCESIFRYKA
ncbi:hypothetical protein JHK85_022178 [Glycine max]|nr:hypothetical protein JHK85_022178 [Glycine max]